MDPQIPDIPVRSIRKLIPDSPFLRLGNQVRLAIEWRRFIRENVPTAPDATKAENDRKEN
jgi:hypothetical protein